MNADDALRETTDEASRRMIVDLLIDGEPVDKLGLREALNDAATRDYLIDAMLLRQLAIEMAPNTLPAAARRSSVAQFVRWTAAAVVAITTAVAGYTLGRQQTIPTQLSEVPGTDARQSEPAPQPTHTIRFDRGTNWISNLEGR